MRLDQRTWPRLRGEWVNLSQGPSQRGVPHGGLYRTFLPQTGLASSKEEVLLKHSWATLQEEKKFGIVHAIEGIIN